MSDNDNFFDEQSEQSKIKTILVTKYFTVWARIMRSSQRKYPRQSQKINYIDLFAGPGRYKSGKPSTPIEILNIAISDDDLSQSLVTLFNDSCSDYVAQLESEISDLEGIDRLRFQPSVSNSAVGIDIANEFKRRKLNPTFFFIDPFGYKGVSLELIYSVVKDFGSDCILFFNYNRVNMGINNPSVYGHMCELLGQGRVDELKEKVDGLDSEAREFTVVNEMVEAIKGLGARFVLPFGFKNEDGARTSHHLLFISKHPLGYGIMKDIMAKYSSSYDQGVASFEYAPVTNPQLTLLFSLNRPLEQLGDDLLDYYRGQTLTMKDVYERHHIGKPFVSKNYKYILSLLESEGKIECNPPAAKRRFSTVDGEKIKSFANHVLVTFPE